MIKLVLNILLVVMIPGILVSQVSMDDILVEDTREKTSTLREKSIAVLRDIIEGGGRSNRDSINTAVRALGESGNVGIISLLWERYESAGDIEGKAVAIEAIGKLGDRNEVDKLKSVFTKSDTPASWHDLKQTPPSVVAGMALLTLKDRSGIVEMNSYLTGRDRQLQQRAAQAFGNTGESSSNDLLAGLLEEKEELIREAAIEALVKTTSYGDPYVIASLKPILEDSGKKIRIKAALALGVLGDKSGEKLLQEELEKNKYQPDLLKVLYDLGDRERAMEIVKLLSEELRDEERKKFEDILADIHDDSTIDPLIGLLDSEDTDIVISATRVLAELKAEKALDTLVSHLKHEDQEVNAASVEALGLIGSKKAIQHLKETMDELREADPYETRKRSLRQKVAIALGNLGDEAGMQYFFNERMRRGKRYTEVNGIDLAEIKNKAVIPEMMRVLKDTDIDRTSGSFIAILEALEEFETREVVPILIGLLQKRKTEDEVDILSRDELIAVVKYIGVLGDVDCVEELEHLLTDRDVEIHLEIAIAILRLLPEEEVPADE